MADVSYAELRQHVPAFDGWGHTAACSCGWKLEGETTDYWLSWMEHLPAFAASGRLVLNAEDRKFLGSCHIKSKP